jgi:AcrR family transcriptional regulator
MIKLDAKFEQLLLGAMQVFMKYGLRSVTMDDLARHLAVSKKTLYKYVKDKKDLILQGIEYHQNMEHCAMKACVEQNLNAIDEMFEITKMVISQLQNVNPSVMFDLEKYYPEAKAKFTDYKMTVVKTWHKDNLERGIKEGYFRKDLDTDIITALFISRMDDFFEYSELIPNKDYSFKDVYIETFRYHIRGIASEKGIEYLKEKMKELNK